MSKIVITVHDKANGGVSISAEPSYETLAKKINAGHELTPAETYVLGMLNRAREIGQSKSSKIITKLPRVLRI